MQCFLGEKAFGRLLARMQSKLGFCQQLGVLRSFIMQVIKNLSTHVSTYHRSTSPGDIFRGICILYDHFVYDIMYKCTHPLYVSHSTFILSLSHDVYEYCKNVCVCVVIHMISLYQQVNIYKYGKVYTHIGHKHIPSGLPAPVVLNHCKGAKVSLTVSPPIYAVYLFEFVKFDFAETYYPCTFTTELTHSLSSAVKHHLNSISSTTAPSSSGSTTSSSCSSDGETCSSPCSCDGETCSSPTPVEALSSLVYPSIQQCFFFQLSLLTPQKLIFVLQGFVIF